MGGGKGGSAPPPPDYSAIADASRYAANLSFQNAQDTLAWAKEQYWADRDVADLVIESALDRMDKADEQASKDRKRYEEKYQPIEDSLIQDAKDYASPARMDEEAGKAGAAVSQQFDQARQAAQARLESFGVDPSQTRAGALDLGTRMQQAAAKAGAENAARTQTENIGRALRSEAVNIGRGYPGQIAQSYNTAIQSGNAGVNSGIATTATGSNAMGNPVQWMGQGVNALNTWGNTLHMGHQDAIATFKAQTDADKSGSSGMGSILGMIGGIGGKLLSGGAFAEGGAVPDSMGAHPPPARGGPQHSGVPVPPEVSPSGGAIPDDVPARLNAGEFVVPRDVVNWMGEEKLQKLIESAREKKQEAPAKPKAGPMPQQAPIVNTTGALPVR